MAPLAIRCSPPFLSKHPAGIPSENITFARNTYTFEFPQPPSTFLDTFRRFYGPTVNAFEAPERGGRSNDLQAELENLFNSHNRNSSKDTTTIPATFLRVTVEVDQRMDDNDDLSTLYSRRTMIEATLGPVRSLSTSSMNSKVFK